MLTCCNNHVGHLYNTTNSTRNITQIITKTELEKHSQSSRYYKVEMVGDVDGVHFSW